MRNLRPLTSEETDAVAAFAKEQGRRWKAKLANVYWYNARIWRETPHDNGARGSILHGLRNSHGPAWLDAYRLPKA